MSGSPFNLRNVLILLGIIISGIGIVYFATTFIDRLSDWGRVLSLLLLTVIFVALGRHFEEGPDAGLLVERRGWRWLRIPTALYLLGLLATLTGILVFLGIEDLDPVFKALGAVAIGLGLILWAARRFAPPNEG